MELPTLERDRDTVEYLIYQFDTFTLANGAPATAPTSYQLAAVPDGVRPTEADWNPAPWLAGPLTPGLRTIYLRFTDTPEVPVRRVGRLVVT